MPLIRRQNSKPHNSSHLELISIHRWNNVFTEHQSKDSMHFARLIPRSKKISTALCIVLLAAIMSSLAASGDEHWDNQFGWPGPAVNSYAITTHNGRLYASGVSTST